MKDEILVPDSPQETTLVSATVITNGKLKSARFTTVREARSYIYGVEEFNSNVEYEIRENLEPIDKSNGFVEARKIAIEAFSNRQEIPATAKHSLDTNPQLTERQNLINALRGDMRLASRELTKLRAWFDFVHSLEISEEVTDVIERSLDHIDDAFASLDCSEAFKDGS